MTATLTYGCPSRMSCICLPWAAAGFWSQEHICPLLLLDALSEQSSQRQTEVHSCILKEAFKVEYSSNKEEGCRDILQCEITYNTLTSGGLKMKVLSAPADSACFCVAILPRTSFCKHVDHQTPQKTEADHFLFCRFPLGWATTEKQPCLRRKRGRWRQSCDHASRKKNPHQKSHLIARELLKDEEPYHSCAVRKGALAAISGVGPSFISRCITSGWHYDAGKI
ncbi:hypothetical protein ATANTOWER_018271 [Ataeniobius toweri]|uniref:SWIM-type domain-containing protein n=1 Tax=Ataeniobius toweri TaxID=208326 RepID=A0ABU7BT51_9TELE|nr:hypothetical protein [Ataeniobius toweri]